MNTEYENWISFGTDPFPKILSHCWKNILAKKSTVLIMYGYTYRVFHNNFLILLCNVTRDAALRCRIPIEFSSPCISHLF
jgi:hypothetical protein